MILKALALLLALSAAGAAVQTWRLDRLQDEIAAERAAKVQVALTASENLRRTEDALNTQARKATDVLIARQKAAAVDAAGTDAAYRGLLDAIANSGGSPEDPAAACRHAGERVRILEGLLAEGAGLAAEGAARVGRLDASLTALQEHARIGLVPVKP